MKYLFSIAVASVFIAFPQTGDAQETLSELNKRQFELINEERSLAQQIAMAEWRLLFDHCYQQAITGT